MKFKDRAEAGHRLAEALGAPLDLVLVRKIGAPGQPELALGAVVDGGAPMIVRNPGILAATGTSTADFDAIGARELAEIERRRGRYLGTRAPVDVAGRVVIVVDDGIATGATIRAALRATRQRGPARLVLAVPVASSSALASLRSEVDEVVCLTCPEGFCGVGQFYDDFRQVSDDEVVALLARPPTDPPPVRV